MAYLELGPSDGLSFEYDPPAHDRPTLVFVNALTGHTGVWQAVVAPRCRAAGLGTLCWNCGASRTARSRPARCWMPP